MLKKSLCCLMLLTSGSVFAGDKLLGTAAVNHIEGSAGGGITPWAVMSGYATDNQWGASAFMSRSEVDDYSLDSMGFAVNYHDRWELSYARLTFAIDAGLPDIKMNVLGLKYRISGDAVYSDMPQFSVGIEYKTLPDFTIGHLLGGKHDSGTDIYLAATKAWIDGPFHRTLVLNLNARASKANQIGLLGFGSATDDGYDISFEASAAIFINRNFLIGTEYRQKGDRLAAKENDWYDVFATYLVNKSFSVTAAYVNLGDVADAADQDGFYLSLQGTF